MNQRDSSFREENSKKIWKCDNLQKALKDFYLCFLISRRWSLGHRFRPLGWWEGKQLCGFFDKDTMVAFGSSFYLFIRYSYQNSWKWVMGQDMAAIWFMPIWSFVVIPKISLNFVLHVLSWKVGHWHIGDMHSKLIFQDNIVMRVRIQWAWINPEKPTGTWQYAWWFKLEARFKTLQS